MKFFARVAILFYVMLIYLASGAAILLVAHVAPFEDLSRYLDIIYYDQQMRIIVGAVSCLLMFLSYAFAKIITGGKQKERTIAFDNPSGRVSVSLNAVEELIRRLMYRVPDVKEVRPDIKATKKGIEIELRLILKADVNIPDVTAKLQEMIKNKIQELLGVEEAVIIRIHVGKIVAEESKSKHKDDVGEKTDSAVPFQGYRR